MGRWQQRKSDGPSMQHAGATPARSSKPGPASPRDMDFLRAMAEDDGPSSAADIGRRIAARTNLVANYRARLLAAGLIEPRGHGKVDFAIPGLREHLRPGAQA